MGIRYSLYVHYDAQLYTQNQQGEHEIYGVTYTLKNKTYQEK